MWEREVFEVIWNVLSECPKITTTNGKKITSGMSSIYFTLALLTVMLYLFRVSKSGSSVRDVGFVGIFVDFDFTFESQIADFSEPRFLVGSRYLVKVRDVYFYSTMYYLDIVIAQRR